MLSDNKLVDWYKNHKVYLKKADMPWLEDTVRSLEWNVRPGPVLIRS